MFGFDRHSKTSPTAWLSTLCCSGCWGSRQQFARITRSTIYDVSSTRLVRGGTLSFPASDWRLPLVFGEWTSGDSIWLDTSKRIELGIALRLSTLFSTTIVFFSDPIASPVLTVIPSTTTAILGLLSLLREVGIRSTAVLVCTLYPSSSSDASWR